MENIEPIITRIKERRMVTVGKDTFEVEETVYLDYGRQGISTVYIRPSVPASPAPLQRVLRSMGYELIPPANATA